MAGGRSNTLAEMYGRAPLVMLVLLIASCGDDPSNAGSDPGPVLQCRDYWRAEAACLDLADRWCSENTGCGSTLSLNECVTTKRADFGCDDSINPIDDQTCMETRDQCLADVEAAACQPKPQGIAGFGRLGAADTPACRTLLEQIHGGFGRP